jgi:hypothetical protein
MGATRFPGCSLPRYIRGLALLLFDLLANGHSEL